MDRCEVAGIASSWRPGRSVQKQDVASVYEALLEGANIDASDPAMKSKTGMTPLMLACRDGHSRLVGLLLDQKADVNAIEQQSQWSPLFIAARNQHLDVVMQLVAGRADVLWRDRQGRTVLESVQHDDPRFAPELRELLELEAPEAFGK